MRGEKKILVVQSCSPSLETWWMDLKEIEKTMSCDYMVIKRARFISRISLAMRLLFQLNKLKEYDKIVFITPPFYHFLASYLLKSFYKKRLITVVLDNVEQMIIENQGKGKIDRFIRKNLFYPFLSLSIKISLRNCEGIFCVSKFLCEKYRRYSKVFYSPNGSQTEFISGIKPQKLAKEYIYYCGSFSYWRGVDLLIKSFLEFKKESKSDIKLVLIGGSKEEIEQYPGGIKDLLKNKEIIYQGHLPRKKVMAYMKGAKITVLPSRDTLLARSISSVKSFDYISAEVPQICTNTGDHALWVKKLKVGIVTPPTLNGIKNGISELLNNKQKYASFKKNCEKNKQKIDYMYLKKDFLSYLRK